jgi:Tfp pilus assembly protein PilE
MLRRCVSRQALTLLELVIVLLILVALAGVVVPLVESTTEDARCTTTKATLITVREAVTQFWLDAPTPKQLLQKNAGDMGRSDYPQLYFLFVNPASWNGSSYAPTLDFDQNYKVGWRGPYLRDSTERDECKNPVTYQQNPAANFTSVYGNNGDKIVVDGWRHPIILQNPRVLSDGVTPIFPDGVLDVRVVSAGPNGKIDIDPGLPSGSLNASNIGDDEWISFQLR